MKNYGSASEALPPQISNSVLADRMEKGGAAGPEGGGIADLPAKLLRYGTARHRATQIMAYLERYHKPGAGRPGPEKRASDQLRGCGEYLGFRHYTSIDQVRLHTASFCRQHLFCPLCAIRRASKAVSAYVEKFEAVTTRDTTLIPVVLTLTVKNGPDLAERLEHLQKALRTLTDRRRKGRAGGRNPTAFKPIAGAVGAIEATFSEETGWHPHAHIVALLDRYLDQAALSDEWRKITGDSFIVDVRRLDPSRPISDAFCEVLKYTLKFGDMTEARVWEAARIMKGKRLMFSLGNLRGVVVPQSLTDEPLDDLPYVSFFYRYIGAGRYSLQR